MSRARVAALLAATIALVALATRPAAVAQAPSEPALKLADRKLRAGWTERSVNPQARVVGRAWSDLADGCHLVDLAVAAPETAGRVPLRGTLGAELAKEGLALTETGGELFRLTGPGVTGIARIELRGEPVRSAMLSTCYWNEREPARCQAACQEAIAATQPTP